MKNRNGEDYHYFYTLLHQLALRSKWICRPNPAVAALVVKNRRVISWGYTQPRGGRHAEYEALNKLGKRNREMSLYVTLMPCCFEGKTPACTDIIIRSGIREVHIAGLDNDPRMIDRHGGSMINYRSISILKKAGIHIYFDCPPIIQEKLFFLNWDYFKRNAVGLPTITMKYAMTLDGKIAGPIHHNSIYKKNRKNNFRGNVKISGESIDKENHSERARHDAIMVGGNTLRNDNPRLNARFKRDVFRVKLGELLPSLTLDKIDGIDQHKREIEKLQRRISPSLRKDTPFIHLHPQIIQPRPIVLVRSLLPSHLRLMKKKNPLPLFLIPPVAEKFFAEQMKIIFTDTPLRKKMVAKNKFFIYRSSPQDPEFWKILSTEFGINSIFLEGGATLQSYLWKTGLIDRVHVYISPRFFGRGNDALSPLSELSTYQKASSLNGLTNLWQPRITVWGQDIKVSGFIDFQDHLVKKLWRNLFSHLSGKVF